MNKKTIQMWSNSFDIYIMCRRDKINVKHGCDINGRWFSYIIVAGWKLQKENYSKGQIDESGTILEIIKCWHFPSVKITENFLIK